MQNIWIQYVQNVYLYIVKQLRKNSNFSFASLDKITTSYLKLRTEIF
jgi:hypothetical protein